MATNVLPLGYFYISSICARLYPSRNVIQSMRVHNVNLSSKRCTATCVGRGKQFDDEKMHNFRKQTCENRTPNFWRASGGCAFPAPNRQIFWGQVTIRRRTIRHFQAGDQAMPKENEHTTGGTHFPSAF